MSLMPIGSSFRRKPCDCEPEEDIDYFDGPKPHQLDPDFEGAFDMSLTDKEKLRAKMKLLEKSRGEKALSDSYDYTRICGLVDSMKYVGNMLSPKEIVMAAYPASDIIIVMEDGTAIFWDTEEDTISYESDLTTLLAEEAPGLSMADLRDGISESLLLPGARVIYVLEH